MRSIRLLAVAVLAFILTLSSVQIGFAAPQISLSPTCGPPGAGVMVAGSGFVVSAQPSCSIVSSPSGLVADSNCAVIADGTLANTWFIVAAGASGSYLVTVTYFGQVGGPVLFNVGGCGPPPEPYELCLIQLGIEEPEGTVSWLPGYAIVDVPISQCQDKTEYYTDVLGRTIVIHQFNQTRINYVTGIAGPVILIA